MSGGVRDGGPRGRRRALIALAAVTAIACDRDGTTSATVAPTSHATVTITAPAPAAPVTGPGGATVTTAPTGPVAPDYGEAETPEIGPPPTPPPARPPEADAIEAVARESSVSPGRRRVDDNR